MDYTFLQIPKISETLAIFHNLNKYYITDFMKKSLSVIC